MIFLTVNSPEEYSLILIWEQNMLKSHSRKSVLFRQTNTNINNKQLIYFMVSFTCTRLWFTAFAVIQMSTHAGSAWVSSGINGTHPAGFKNCPSNI